MGGSKAAGEKRAALGRLRWQGRSGPGGKLGRAAAALERQRDPPPPAELHAIAPVSFCCITHFAACIGNNTVAVSGHSHCSISCCNETSNVGLGQRGITLPPTPHPVPPTPHPARPRPGTPPPPARPQNLRQAAHKPRQPLRDFLRAAAAPDSGWGGDGSRGSCVGGGWPRWQQQHWRAHWVWVKLARQRGVRAGAAHTGQRRAWACTGRRTVAHDTGFRWCASPVSQVALPGWQPRSLQMTHSTQKDRNFARI